MENAIKTNYTFVKMVDDCVRIRKTGNEASAKRSDARDFIPEQLSGIEISEEKVLHISLGYLERLLRKLAAEFGEVPVSEVKLGHYGEGCGVFTGKISFSRQNEGSTHVEFHWEGRGDVETTWDSFTKWEIQSSK